MSDGLHACPWPGCERRVTRNLWGCKTHWFQIPRELRDRCSDAWRSGNVADHMEALEAIDRWLPALKTLTSLPAVDGSADG